MTRATISALCLAVFAAPAARAADAKHAASLTAAEIAEKNVKARGGLAAWRAVAALRMSGEMEAGGTSDAKLPFVLVLKRPNKMRLELKFAGKTAVQTYDGAAGWKVRPFLNRADVEPFTPDEARSAASSAELDGPLVDYARKGTRLELLGREKVAGRPAFKLRLTSKTGVQRLLWVDAATFLEAKISGDPRKLDGRVHEVEIVYRDFRTVSGLKVPFALETVVSGVKKSHTMNIQSVTVNPPADDGLFARPVVAGK